VTFRHTKRYAHQKELFVAAEGTYTGQFVYCGKKAQLVVGNILPVGQMPEGGAASLLLPFLNHGGHALVPSPLGNLIVPKPAGCYRALSFLHEHLRPLFPSVAQLKPPQPRCARDYQLELQLSRLTPRNCVS